MRPHRLVLVDRGRQHRHRWFPVCSCGEWKGVYRRRKKEAVAQHRQHVRGLRPSAAQQWRPPTPAYLLPEALRSS